MPTERLAPFQIGISGVLARVASGGSLVDKLMASKAQVVMFLPINSYLRNV